jgi:hypothetical protein
MFKKTNFGKLTVVLFLTVLIWVWADLSKTEDYKIKNAVVSIAKTADPRVWVSFDAGPTLSIDDIVVRGPSSRIDTLSRLIQRGDRMEFYFDAAEENMQEGGILLLQPFLNKRIMKRFGLNVESCVPDRVTVQIRPLVKKEFNVSCFDEDGNPLKATMDPAKVEMSVPDGMEGVAKVVLGSADIDRARSAAISMVPFFDLPGRQRIRATAVKITMPEVKLQDEYIASPRLGVELSTNLQGKYVVNIVNLAEIISPFKIKATAEAKRAYEQVPFQVRLEIFDDDTKLTDIPPRELKYDFPDESVRRKEIELVGQAKKAKFQLAKVAPVEEGSVPAP